VAVRKDLERFQTLYYQNMSSIKSTEELNNILNNQRYPFIKTSLGYEGTSSSSRPVNKESTAVIKIESNKHPMHTKSMKFVKQHTNNNNVKSISQDNGKSEEEVNHT